MGLKVIILKVKTANDLFRQYLNWSSSKNYVNISLGSWHYQYLQTAEPAEKIHESLHAEKDPCAYAAHRQILTNDLHVWIYALGLTELQMVARKIGSLKILISNASNNLCVKVLPDFNALAIFVVFSWVHVMLWIQPFKDLCWYGLAHSWTVIFCPNTP